MSKNMIIAKSLRSGRRLAALLLIIYAVTALHQPAGAKTPTEELCDKALKLASENKIPEAFDAAIESYQVAKIKGERNSLLTSHATIGRLLLETGLFEESKRQYIFALDYANQIRKVSPSFEINRQIVEIDIKLGLYDNALKSCDTAEGIAKKNKDEKERMEQLFWCFKTSLKCHIKRGDLKAALKTTSDAAGTFSDYKPYLARVIFEQGECYFMLGQYFQSKTRYDSVIAFGEPVAAMEAEERLKHVQSAMDTLDILAKFEKQMNNKAAAEIRKKYEIKDELTAPDLYAEGLKHEKAKDYPKAAAHYALCINGKLSAKDKQPVFTSYIGMGRVMESLGLFEQSKSWYHNALAYGTTLDKKEPTSFIKQSIGHINLKLGNFNKVLAICRDIETAAKSEKDEKQKAQMEIWASITRILCYNKSKNSAQVIAVAQEMQSRFKTSRNLVVFALIQEGDVYLGQRKLDKARETFNKALEISESSSDRNTSQQRIKFLDTIEIILKKLKTLG